MSQDQLKAFLEKVKESKELQAILAELSKDDKKAVIAFAQEMGIDISENELVAEAELNDLDLDNVAGGMILP